MIDLRLGDCLDVMKNIQDKSVDLILTDPPYGINASTRTRSKSFGGDDGFSVMFFLDNYLREFARILKDDGAIYIFTRYDVMPYWWLRTKLYFQMKNLIIWNKGGGGLGDLKGNYLPDYEMIIFATKGSHKLRGKRMTSVWNIKKEKAEYHIAQKSLQLLKQVIVKSSSEGSLVFDPFMGSGTTGVACKELKRDFVGIELDSNYLEIAKKRIETAQEELTFDPHMEVPTNRLYIKCLRCGVDMGFLVNEKIHPAVYCNKCWEMML